MRSALQGASLLAAVLFAALAVSQSAQASSFATIYNFCTARGCRDGASPQGPVTVDGTGSLYGTTAQFATDEQVLWKLTPSGGGQYVEKVLHRFCIPSAHHQCTTGTTPTGHLAVSAAGAVIGATAAGSGHASEFGTIYQISSAGKFSVVFRFCPKSDCDLTGRDMSFGVTYFGAERGLAWDGRSNVFGITQSGAQTNLGSFFQMFLQHNGRARFQMLAQPTGLYRLINLVTDPAGGQHFYFLVDDQRGFLFDETLNQDGSTTANQLYSFCPIHSTCLEGKVPAALSVDGSENVFGSTTAAADFNKGTAWQLSPPHYNSVDIEHRFCSQADCADGFGTNLFSLAPADANGNVFGVTIAGGGNDNSTFAQAGAGTIFEITAAGDFSKLYSFCAQTNCTDGGVPLGGLWPDGTGSYVGTTSQGGANGAGTVFRFTP